jgi:hypothetical protein
VVTQQGRNAIGVGLDLPKFDITDWYQHILDERVKSHYRVVSKFAPEAVKASFDRHFKQVADTQGEVNEALKQFRTSYDYPSSDSTNARVTAAVSPGQDGSVVECDIELTAKPRQGMTALDWSSALAAVRQELDRAATE